MIIIDRVGELYQCQTKNFQKHTSESHKHFKYRVGVIRLVGVRDLERYK